MLTPIWHEQLAMLLLWHCKLTCRWLHLMSDNCLRSCLSIEALPGWC